MATIWWEQSIGVPAATAWAALRCVGQPHRFFAPVLSDSVMNKDVRTVTFANGLVVRERIISVDEERRRVVYAVLDDRFEQHCASMQLLPVDEQSCRFVWITDFLPAELGSMVQPLVQQGSSAFANAVELGALSEKNAYPDR